MKKLLSTVLLIAMIVGGFFLFGGDISIENGIPEVSFSGNWKKVGISVGNAAGDLLDGLLDGITNSDTIQSIISGVSDTTAPTVDIPEIPEGSNFQVHYIDVGQADSILILCDNSAMLIDGGNDGDGKDVIAYLQQHGVLKLDLVVATHCHEDHLGGLDHVLDAFPVEEVWYPEYRHGTVNEKMFLEKVAEQGLTAFQPAPGTTYTLGSAVCQVLGPITLDADEPNNHSIVIKVIYGETSFLFTGDMELSAETEILDAGYDISCDVLKVSHHGSNSSTKYRWLKAASPTYGVISVGSGNEYGHPTEATLSILEDAEITVLRTDLQGHIVFTSDGTTVTFAVQRNPGANTLAAP